MRPRGARQPADAAVADDVPADPPDAPGVAPSDDWPLGDGPPEPPGAGPPEPGVVEGVVPVDDGTVVVVEGDVVLVEDGEDVLVDEPPDDVGVVVVTGGEGWDGEDRPEEPPTRPPIEVVAPAGFEPPTMPDSGFLASASTPVTATMAMTKAATVASATLRQRSERPTASTERHHGPDETAPARSGAGVGRGGGRSPPGSGIASVGGPSAVRAASSSGGDPAPRAPLPATSTGCLTAEGSVCRNRSRVDRIQ
jgi:hypothetical protein